MTRFRQFLNEFEALAQQAKRDYAKILRERRGQIRLGKDERKRHTLIPGHK